MPQFDGLDYSPRASGSICITRAVLIRHDSESTDIAALLADIFVINIAFRVYTDNIVF